MRRPVLLGCFFVLLASASACVHAELSLPYGSHAEDEKPEPKAMDLADVPSSAVFFRAPSTDGRVWLVPFACFDRASRTVRAGEACAALVPKGAKVACLGGGLVPTRARARIACSDAPAARDLAATLAPAPTDLLDAGIDAAADGGAAASATSLDAGPAPAADAPKTAIPAPTWIAVEAPGADGCDLATWASAAPRPEVIEVPTVEPILAPKERAALERAVSPAPLELAQAITLDLDHDGASDRIFTTRGGVLVARGGSSPAAPAAFATRSAHELHRVVAVTDLDHDLHPELWIVRGEGAREGIVERGGEGSLVRFTPSGSFVSLGSLRCGR